jgi:cytochrome b pre-mRNA-processing protein 3
LHSVFRLARRRHERAGFRLYAAAVAAARTPYLYATLGAPDTLDGRFDLVGLFVFTLIDRLRLAPAPGPALAQAVFDAMFSDMDMTLREMGVGDLSVGKKVKAMWEAFNGRVHAYAAGVSAGDGKSLEQAIARNVWRGAAPPAGAAAVLARMTFAERAHLEQQPLSALARGEVDFLPAERAGQ